MSNQFSGLLKDERVLAALMALEQRLGADRFRIVDHWDTDLRSIGIAHPDDQHRLAYIAVNDDATFYVELETAPAPGSELPYTVDGQFQGLMFEEVVVLVVRHLCNNLGEVDSSPSAATAP